MKKYLLHIGAVFLMALLSLPTLAQLNGTGYYRVRNAAEGQTNQYMSFANDIINFNNIIAAPGGATNLTNEENRPIYVPYAMSCVDAYLKNDIHLTEANFIDPSSVIYIKLKNNSAKTYNLISQGTSLNTLTTGWRWGSNGNVFFHDIFAIINQDGTDAYNKPLYRASVPLTIKATGKKWGLELTLYNGTLTNCCIEDLDGTLHVEIQDSIASFTNNYRWYIEPLTYFNVQPDKELNGKYYTTLKVPFQSLLDANNSSVKKAYVITGVSNGILQYQELTGTIPAGTAVLLECDSNIPADCKLFFPIDSNNRPLEPKFTAADENAYVGDNNSWSPSLSSVDPADETDYYAAAGNTNLLKGTYYSNTDGTMRYNTTSGVNAGYFYGNHYTAPTNLFELGTDNNGKMGFVEAHGITTPQNIQAMPANKAWMEQAGVFAIIRTVNTPVISPATGTYSEPQTVTITAEQGATIEYSTDGGTTWQTYTGAITVDETTTVQARAIIPGLQPNSTGFYAPSEVVSATYTIQESNPTLTANPTSLTINENGGSFTVEGSDLGTDNAGVTRTNGAFVPSLTASTGTATNGDANWYFTPSNGSLNGTVNVTYQGRELVDQTTFNVANNVASAEPVTVTYRPDIYIVTDNGVQNNWNFQNGTQMTNENGIYTATFTATVPNTFILFARKLGDGVNWNTRYVFGPVSGGDWVMPSDKVTENGTIDLYDDDPIKLPYAGDYMITIDATDPDHPTFTISRALAESTLAEIESSGVVGNAYTVTDELIGIWAVNNDNDKLLWAKDQGNVSIDKRPAKTDDQTDYMVTHMKYQHYPWEGYDWDESNWVILDFAALNENPESYVGHKLENKSVSGIYSDANNYTIKLSDAPIFANGDENILDAPDYPGYAGVHSESNYGTKYAWAYNTYIPANFNEDNLNRLVDGVIVGAQSGPNALDNMQDQQLYFMNPKFMEIAHIWGIWEDNGANGRFVMIEPSFANNQTINAWDLHGAVDVINWKYNRKDQNNYGQPHQLTKGAHDFHALIVRKSTGSKLTSDPSSGIYGIMPLDLPENGHPTAVKELIGNRVIKSISYYNVMGMESSRPFKGINIVVTRYSDGSSTTAKVLR